MMCTLARTPLRLVRWGLAAFLFLVVGLVACQPAKLPEDMPGPANCGLKDPRNTAPGMLSMAQKTTIQKMGKPADVEPNEHGGLDWVYKQTAGSVFGQEETVTVYTFDKDGLLKGTKKDLISKVGK